MVGVALPTWSLCSVVSRRQRPSKHQRADSGRYFDYVLRTALNMTLALFFGSCLRLRSGSAIDDSLLYWLGHSRRFQDPSSVSFPMSMETHIATRKEYV